jgi:flagellar M-ring protein FliF
VDFFNKALAQLSDFFRSMTPAGRITAGILLGIVVISAAYLFNHPLSMGDGYLFGGEAVAIGQLPAIEAAFGKKNLTDYELQGNRIRVPQGKQALYMAALADAGVLPHNFLDSLKNSLDSCGPFVDRKKREELIKVALQDELSKIIGQMNGMERATVLYNVETPQGFNSRKLITASVTVKPVGSQTLNPDQVQMIRQAVGPAIGAAPESIAVVDINGRAYPGGGSIGGDDMTQDRYLNTKHQYEREYADSIRQALLSFVKGAVVTVNVELHPELEESESSDKFDPKPAASDISDNGKISAPAISLPSGLMSVTTQGGVPNSPLTVVESGNGLRIENDPPVRRDRDLASRQSRQVRKAGLTPKRVTVSVGVPSSYYEDVWQQRNLALAGAFLKKPDPAMLAQIETEVNSNIRRSVMGIIPMPEDSNGDAVTVTSFTSMPVAEMEKPTATDFVLVWLTDHANGLGMGLLAIICLGMVRSIVRSLPRAAVNGLDERGANAIRDDGMVERHPQHAAATAIRRRRAKSGPSPRDDLVDIVRDDPDAAANVLRNWIGSAN